MNYQNAEFPWFRGMNLTIEVIQSDNIVGNWSKKTLKPEFTIDQYPENTFQSDCRDLYQSDTNRIFQIT